MTGKEKAELLKDTISVLYEKEGRSISYISKVLYINRKTVSDFINEQGMRKADVHYLTPSNQKYLNAHKKEIIDMLDGNMTVSKIAKRLNISRDRLLKTFIPSDDEVYHHYRESRRRAESAAMERRQKMMDDSRLSYEIKDIEGEEWRDIMGYAGYQISNMGRVRHLSASYKAYHLIMPTYNAYTGRYYVTLPHNGGHKTLNRARLVAHTFIDGYSSQSNTVDHINGDASDDRAANLEWVSQAENNVRKYRNGDAGRHAGYAKRGKFKSVVMDDKYEFKTIRALARFLNVSETQAARYIDGECASGHSFKFTY